LSGLIHAGAWDGREYVGDERRLLLIEPQADAFRRLSANFNGNPKVTLVNCALGARRGTVEMHLSEPDHSSSILVPKEHFRLYPDVTFSGETEKVAVETLDGVVPSQDYDEMVIDVQGYELEVLKGARKTLPQIQRLVCEVNLDEVYEGCALVDEVDAFLDEHGFRRTALDLHARGGCGDATYER
jgi:FkbM family methyltransferase